MANNAENVRRPVRQRFLKAGPTPVFRLYVSGATHKSTIAITNMKRVLEELFGGDYELLVTDIYQEPEKVEAAQVYLVPMLVREQPEPEVRITGDFSSEDDVRSLLVAGLAIETPDR
jgi:circadian clock protein KaiB